MSRQNNINLSDLIYPLFVKGGVGLREDIPSMPGVYRLSPDVAIGEVEELAQAGIDKILIFGVPDKKDANGSSSFGENNIVSQAVRAIKKEVPGITVMTDVCLCAYTSHGHCGIIDEGGDNLIDNKATLDVLGRIALSHAEAGADFVAPSAMADGQVGMIRNVLDENGFDKTRIMGYSAKFESNAYGPFRNVADSAPKIGSGRPYQLDYEDKEKALSKIDQDITEGADIVMVKPALWYLDVVKESKNRFNKKLAVYNVSGEYAMVKYGAFLSLWDERKMVMEILSSFKRAGADLIITYHAKDVAKWL